MARIWRVGSNELRDEAIPFAPGSDEYYRYVATWRSKALGLSYQNPETASLDGDQGMDREAYQRGLEYWWQKQYEDTRAMDKSGQQATGYLTYGGSNGRDFSIYDGNGNGQPDSGEKYGKYGGAGNRNPLASADNRWNDLDGKDVRTDQQKFYDRDLSGYNQVADAQGSYSWYADETYNDKNGTKQKRKVNLTGLGDRDGVTAENGYGTDAKGIPAGGTWSGKDIWNYNDAPDKSYFDNEVRNRKNLSVYGRTG